MKNLQKVSVGLRNAAVKKTHAHRKVSEISELVQIQYRIPRHFTSTSVFAKKCIIEKINVYIETVTLHKLCLDKLSWLVLKVTTGGSHL